MQPDVLKAIGAVIGALVSAPAILACIRMILFFGEMRSTMKLAGETLTALGQTLERFTEEVRRDLRDIDGRVRVLEDREGVSR